MCPVLGHIRTELLVVEVLRSRSGRRTRGHTAVVALRPGQCLLDTPLHRLVLGAVLRHRVRTLFVVRISTVYTPPPISHRTPQQGATVVTVRERRKDVLLEAMRMGEALLMMA